MTVVKNVGLKILSYKTEPFCTFVTIGRIHTEDGIHLQNPLKFDEKQIVAKNLNGFPVARFLHVHFRPRARGFFCVSSAQFCTQAR